MHVVAAPVVLYSTAVNVRHPAGCGWIVSIALTSVAAVFGAKLRASVLVLVFTPASISSDCVANGSTGRPLRPMMLLGNLDNVNHARVIHSVLHVYEAWAAVGATLTRTRLMECVLKEILRELM